MSLAPVLKRSLAALFLVLLGCELLLRAGGLFFGTGKALVRSDGETRVLCEGDSFVRGIGGRGFPEQLEEILNSARAGRRFKVYNAGVNGSNSSAMLARLPGELDALRPDVLLLLVGSSNHWNSLGASRAASAESVLMHSSLYRFCKLAYLRLKGSHGHLISRPALECRPSRFSPGYNDSERQRFRPWFELKKRGGEDSVRSCATPKAAEYCLELAGLYAMAGWNTRAQSLAAKAALVPQAAPRALLASARLYMQSAEHEKALASALKAAELDASLSWLEPYAMGFRAESRAEYADAAAWYAKAFSYGGRTEDVYAALCRSRVLAGKDAVESCSAAVEKYPGSPDTLKARLACLEKEGDVKGGWRLVGSAPNVAKEELVWQFYSWLLSSGDKDGAFAYASGKGGGMSHLLALAELFFESADDLSARQALEKAASSQEALPAKYYLISGDIAQAACDDKAAFADYAKARSLSPDYWGSYYALGDLYGKTGEYSKAEALLRKAAKLAPSEPRIYRQLGRVFVRSGRPGDSVEAYFKAIALSPLSEDLLREARAAYSASGRTEDFLRLPAEIPAVAANPEYINFASAGGARISEAESELQRELRQDLEAACALARRRGIPVIFSSYPERELPGITAAAKACGAEYVNLLPRFSRFKSRRDFISYDNDHPGSVGYKAMAEEYSAAVLKTLGLGARK